MADRQPRTAPEPAAAAAARRVQLAGAHNVRDLGGLPTGDGRVTVHGRIYRSEFLAAPETITDPGLQVLGLRSVVDLRRRGEVSHEQVAWGEHSIELHHVPLRLASGTTWHAGYHRYLVDGPERVVTALRTLLDPSQQPALFHCAAGKDRTGVVAALLLDSLGVRREAIVADYELTVHGIGAIIDRLVDAEPYRAQLAGTTAADHHPRADVMSAFLAWLDREWDGGKEWLRAHGFTDRELHAHENTLLAPAPTTEES